jgi:hypothetical protein
MSVHDGEAVHAVETHAAARACAMHAQDAAAAAALDAIVTCQEKGYELTLLQQTEIISSLMGAFDGIRARFEADLAAYMVPDGF